MSQQTVFEKPRWLRDLARFLPLKSQFVLSGNVRDLQISESAPGTYAAVSLTHALHQELKASDYSATLVYDLVSGFTPFGSNEAEMAASRRLMERVGLGSGEGNAPAGAPVLIDVLGKLAALDGPPVALVIDFASRLLIRNDAMSEGEQRLFSNALVQSHRARPRPSGPTKVPAFNTVIWIVEREGNLPDWLIIDNPRLRHIPVAKPDTLARGAIAPQLLRNMPEGANLTDEVVGGMVREFVEQTEGLLLVDLTAISQLAKRENILVTKVANAIRNYKVGVTEDPWLKIPKAKIRDGERFLKERVKGQDHAVVHMMDIIKRAVTGVGANRRGGRPRGVAFLAGPTGVGKTELAKTVTSLLFNDENSYIRFDMSEFSAEHADQRLIGAPPGYVGYDAGGELTNAIRERPFSVVLFDEIEKAHPRILDKFLQILDDGVLTSGRGERVYFSEALILFTSNLGIYRLDENGDRVLNVAQTEEYAGVQKKVRSEIDRHFKQVINRPELLNRMGENIIVFDFVRKDVAVEIFDAMVANTLKDVAAQDIQISISDAARAQLLALCLADLSNGGRGIRNKVEAHLINPLARALFDTGLASGSEAAIVAVKAGKITQLELREGRL
jgi:energy-coupling factor transporter ATP-binding protein EcfA2